jgi:beta-galactosidase
MRQVLNINTNWQFTQHDEPLAKFPDSRLEFERVSLPHGNAILPHNNFTEREYAFVSWYRREIVIPLEARGKRIFVDFDGVMIAAQVFVNGVAVGDEHRGGFTPFSRDITEFVRFGASNLLSVRVDSTERADIPPFGGLVDFLCFGGIYRDVYLRFTDTVLIRNVASISSQILEPEQSLMVNARVLNTNSTPATMTAKANLWDESTLIASQKIQITLEPECESAACFQFQHLKVERWELEHPRLYRLEVELQNGDALTTQVGFRSAEFREDGAFYLNGKALKLRGLNRHQSFPYIGMAAPARLQRKDAEIIKYDLACNIVRTSHYPQSPHFLDHCDKIGLLVLEEIPGWQHIGDTAWQEVSKLELRAMIERDRNHPSIIMWGVRINESPDHFDFYSATNQLAHELDPSRATGGIRCFHGSELLEDVYTMNDFKYDLGTPDAKKYLVTEYAGHMYPTKTFDQEERVVKHMLHHAHVLNQIYNLPIAGGIGWSAFDYNTHAQFGSGDRICYHGVMDIFRQPKMVAALYASQLEAAERVVLEPMTYWTRGDLDEGRISPLWICSNCDRVDVLVDGVNLGAARRSERFPHLPNPPFVMDYIPGGWGEHFGELEVRGYSGGVLVEKKKIAADGVPVKLEAQLDDTELNADGADMTRLSLQATDQYGNIQPFAFDVVKLEVSGPALVIGPNPVALVGGRVSVFLKATNNAGTIRIRATTSRLETPVLVLQSVALPTHQMLELNASVR